MLISKTPRILWCDTNPLTDALNLYSFYFQIYRKGAFKIVHDNLSEIVVDTADLHSYVGNAVFNTERIYDVTPPGVVMGLAWTAMGTYE